MELKKLEPWLNVDNTRKFLENMSEKTLHPTFTEPSVYNIEVKSPHAKTEQLLEEANEKYDVQISLLQEKLQVERDSNTELQIKLDKSNFELKQLNDKISAQNLYIKQLKADLKNESLQREIAETKLNAKDWKTAFVGLLAGLIVLCVEHFMLPLFS